MLYKNYFHGRNLYDFQRSKPLSKLHLLYLYPLSKQCFPNYSRNTRRSSLRISRSTPVSQIASKQVLPHSFHTPSGTWRKIRHALLGNSAHTYAQAPLKWGSQNYILCLCWSRHDLLQQMIVRTLLIAFWWLLVTLKKRKHWTKTLWSFLNLQKLRKAL